MSVWALAFAKISITLLLLRIQRHYRGWVIFSYCGTVFILVVAIATTAIQLSLCRPISAMWDHTKLEAVCIPIGVVQEAIVATSALTILTDVILSLVPLLFVIRIRDQNVKRSSWQFLWVWDSSRVLHPLKDSPRNNETSHRYVLYLNSALTTNLTEAIGDPLLDAVGVHFWTMLEVQLG
jgi:hypothetical protein